MEDKRIQQPQLNNPTESSQSFVQRWLPTIAGIVIVVLVGGGVFAYQTWWSSPSEPQTQEPLTGTTPAEFPEIANWKMFRGEEFGFEVKYPPGGEVTKTSYGLRIMLPLEEEGTNLSEKYLDITIDGEPPHTGQSEWWEGNVLINGNLFIKERGVGAAAGNRYETEFYTINREGRKYILSFTLHSGNIGNYVNPPKEFNKEKESAIFNQILSTFKFIDQEATASWKTYRNEKFGFEVRHPVSHPVFISAEYEKQSIVVVKEADIFGIVIDEGKTVEDIIIREETIFGSATNITTTSLGGFTAKEIQTGDSKGFTRIVVAEHPYKDFVFSIRIAESFFDLGFPDQILSSFRFIE